MKKWFAVFALSLLVNMPAHAQNAQDSFYRGVDFFEQENYSAAVGPLSDAVATDPLWAEAHQYLGRALLKLGRWVEAVERLTRAYELLPDSEKTNFWKELWASVLQAFTSLLKIGEVEQALVVLKDGWTLSQDNVTAREELVLTLVSSGAKLLEDDRLQEWLRLLEENEVVADPPLTSI